jgi:hypothetical protein
MKVEIVSSGTTTEENLNNNDPVSKIFTEFDNLSHILLIFGGGNSIVYRKVKDEEKN